MTSSRRKQKYNRLMHHRMRSVLLVSTAYDAFVLQEEGNLTEQIFLEYKALSLSSAPHVTHVASEEAALEALEKERFDLVLRVARLANTDLGEFGRRVKELRPGTPVVVLGFDHGEMARLRRLVSREAIDSIFLWNGDAKILLAIIKEAEDRANIDEDIAIADLRVILVVEDSIRYYSAFLSVLYPELMKQSQSLFAEGTSRLDKLLRMRTRPKVVHASDYEEAEAIVARYRDNLLALISDLGFPRQGKLDPRAGLQLARRVRQQMPDLPIVLQSADEKYAAEAVELGMFVTKNSPSLLQQVRDFLIEHLGFGPFIFRLADGSEVARASDIREFRECLTRIPAESLQYHASHNHISNWLLARSEFDLAAKLRPQKVSDFPSLDALRRYLIDELGKLRRTELAGTVTDFSRRHFDGESLFQRLGGGMLGGKARGLAFLNHLLTERSESGSLAGMPIRIPQTFVLTTEVFDRFLDDNRLRNLAAGGNSDEMVRQLCLAAHLPDDVTAGLRVILENLSGPLAVRSSSLLEDDMLHPFAGIYDTVMIPNNAPGISERLEGLKRAVKLVFASAFCSNARAYLKATANRAEEEKMAVIIQRLVGRRYGERFYPHVSGVAHSYNFYPLPPQQAADGVVHMALGLGRIVVEGGEYLRFCPRYPAILPQVPTPDDFLKYSQRNFYALDLAGARSAAAGEADFTRRYDLPAAEQDGTLQLLASIYDTANGIITESPDARGPWVLTFNNILKHRAVPLAAALEQLLGLATEAMGTAVELEFACDLGAYASRFRGQPSSEPAVLYALQLRPVRTSEALPELAERDIAPDGVVCRSHRSLGHGRHADIRDVIYVRPQAFEPSRNPAIARDIERMNAELLEQGRGYLLIGPGRWGSADHWLGIPVQWAQISAARVIVEATLPDYRVEPSSGTHFFHNLTSLRLGYLTVAADADPGGDRLDWEWLDRQPAHCQTELVRHLRLERPLLVELDGQRGRGLVLKPGAAAELSD